VQHEYYDCFLSYRSADYAAAETIHRRLTGAGFSVWWDKIYLEAGMRWHEEIERHCEASRVVLPLPTPEWHDSEWTRYETYGAEHTIPLLLRGEWEKVAPAPLAGVQGDLLNLASATDGDCDRLFARIRTLLEEPKPERQGRQFLLSHRPIEHFVGRDRTVVELHEKLFLTRMTALTHGSVIALPALGGVGKTTLARHYAEKFWRCYRQMFWVDCRLGLAAGFARIYDFLHPGEEAAVPLEIRAARAKQALAQHGVERLLILDNAEDEDSVLPWILETGNCHVLITSRFAGWSKGIESYPVWELKPEPAKQLLLARSGLAGDASQEAPAEKVAEKLQYLPLALEQAAAYVAEQTGFGFDDYLKRYEANEKAFLDRRTRGATDYPLSVYLTWRTTVDRLPEGARAMLRLHAFFAPTPFPVVFYVKGAKELGREIRAAGRWWARWRRRSPDEMAVRDWKTSLVKYSMANAEPEDCIAVHALVQAVERHAMSERSPEAAAETARRAARLFRRVTPAPLWDLASRALWEKLASHSETLAANEHIDDKIRGDLLGHLAEASRHAGDYSTGADRARRALEARERGLGSEHPHTLTSVNELGVLLYNEGDYAAAEPLYRRALAASERVLGSEHPDTLSSVNNLAGLLRSQGDYAGAEPLLRRALGVRERVLGRQHPSTLTSVNNLAGLLISQGVYAGAEPLLRRALAASERVLGSEHPATLASVDNLAEVLRNNGEHAAAEPLYRRSLEARERVLGSEHPNTLTSVNNLALLPYTKGDYTTAEPLFRRALEVRERVLGREHPHTLISVNNLAFLLESKGDYAGAELLYRRALEASERVLGREHPDTIASVNNLAELLRSKGDYAAAEPLLRRALDAWERVLGSEHPDTLTSVNNLVLLLYNEGDYAAAEPLYGRASESARIVLGPDHPDAKLFAKNHAGCVAAMRGKP
jgi:tetratricopeptide (TPR) repeat protein